MQRLVRRRTQWAYGLCLSLVSTLSGQSPQIIRFIPGVYRENTLHRIDLYNPTSQTLDLSRWLLVTRDYSFEFPAGTQLPPYKRLTIGKRMGDIRLGQHPNFLIRIGDPTQAGHYAVLIDAQGRSRSGLYLAPIAQVVFLPDSGTHISQQGRPIAFYVPSETAPVWQFVPWDPDPITGVVLISGQWRYTTADEEKEKQLYAPLRFGGLYGQADSNGVLLSYEMEVREPCGQYTLQRRLAKMAWQPLATPSCPPPGLYRLEYLDTDVVGGVLYEYRLQYEGSWGQEIASLPLTIQSTSEEPSFQMRVSQGFLRLYVKQGQPIKIKLLNAYYEELIRLYDGWLNGGVENVFTWDAVQFAQGHWIVVWTPTRRYWQTLSERD